MNSIKIFVDGLQIDLGGDSLSIPITYELMDIKNLTHRKGTTTKTVKVPRTNKNDKIFGGAFDVSTQNQFDKYAVHRILIEEDTYPIFDGLMKILSVDIDEISFFCFADVSRLKTLFGEKTLNDLNLNDLDHVYDETIFDTWAGNYPVGVSPDYFYPLIDYGRFRSLTPANDPENPDILITDVYPAIYLYRVIRQICLDNGYSLNTSFFNDPITSKMLIPFTNELFVHSSIGGIAINGFYGNNNTYQNLGLDITGAYPLKAPTEIEDPLNQWSQVDDDYTASASQTIRYEVDFVLILPSNNYVINPISYFTVEIDRGSGFVEVRREPIERANRREFFNALYVGNETLGAGDKIRFMYEKNIEGLEMNFRANTIKLDPSFGGLTIEPGEIVQIAPNLPQMKQADLFRACYQMFNWVVSVDDVQGVVSIETFEEFYRGEDQIDMSHKLSLNPKPKIEYIPLNYSRKYDFKYKHDDQDYLLLREDERQSQIGNYKFGDGRIYLDEQGEATLIGEVPFSPTVTGQSFSGTPGQFIDLPSMLDSSEPDIKNTAHAPRILINGGYVSVARLSNDAYSILEVENLGSYSVVPLCYFQKRKYEYVSIDAFDLNLSFSVPAGVGNTLGNLGDKYYLNPLRSISVSPQVVAYFNISGRDVAMIDFKKLWYVSYFGGIFRLNKIPDYLPNSLQPTKVELIKVGVFNPNTQDYETFS